MKETIKSAQDMKNLASRFIFGLKQRAGVATVVGLYGDLGAGKTTFTKGVAKALGIFEVIASPTFVIMKIYELSEQLFKHLVHIDAYRLEKSSELKHLGWSEIIYDPENLVLVEWPEKVADIMPEHTKIQFMHTDEHTREVEIIYFLDN